MCLRISTRELGVPCQDSQGTWELARNEFLQRASAYFPSLRYLTLATPNLPARPSNSIAPIPAYPGDYVSVWTWWRVHRNNVGAPVEIREIPVWEGRRVRDFLRDVDAETADDFDREYLSVGPLTKGAYTELTLRAEQAHSGHSAGNRVG